METCEGEHHVFKPEKEICECGEVPRHRVLRCPTCQREYWSLRQPTTEQRETPTEEQL